jgi:hypothetical protein
VGRGRKQGGEVDRGNRMWTGGGGEGKKATEGRGNSGKGNRQMDKRAGAIGRVDEQQGPLEERSDGGGGGHGKR